MAASIAFPLWLVPKLGLVRSAILFGIVNAGVALWSTFLFRDQLESVWRVRTSCAAVLLLLGGGMYASNWIAATAAAHEIPVLTQDGDFDALNGVAGLTVIPV